MAISRSQRQTGQNPAIVLTEDRLKFSGSAIVDNISYTGADIKIVIHQYKSTNNFGSDYTVPPDQVANLQNSIDELRRQRAHLVQRQSVLKPATQGLERLRGSLNNIDKQIDSYMNTIFGIEEKHTSEAQQLNSSSAKTKVLAEAQTISISTYREKTGVRSLGSSYPKGFTRGPRQIAGSIVFTVFDKDVLFDLLEAHPSDIEASTVTSAIMDQLPPVDILITFANELGGLSRMSLYGVEFLSSGIVLSIEDLITENTVQWVARDYDPMRTVALPVLDRGQNELYQQYGVRASNLLFEEDYKNVRTAVSPFERFKRRRNPFQ